MNYWRILFLSLFVVACSNSESNRSSEEPPSDGGEDVVGTNTEPEIVEMEGMIHIENGRQFTLQISRSLLQVF